MPDNAEADKMLVFVRHGERNPDSALLTSKGAEEIAKTADKLIAMMIEAGTQSCSIYCSRAQRSERSAEILTKKFKDAGIEVSLKKDYRIERGPIIDVLETLKDESEDTVFFVGHQGTTWEALKILTYKPIRTLHSGEAVVLKCGRRAWKTISTSSLNTIVDIISPNPA
jgi:phosphohistidine phosphatase SixA